MNAGARISPGCFDAHRAACREMQSKPIAMREEWAIATRAPLSHA